MQVKYEESRELRCPPLPLEVWECIIAQIDAKYHPRTWLNIRRVSHLLKAATEHIFATEHLPQSRIEFRPLVLREASLSRNPEVIQIQLSFEGLSDNGNRAIFTSKNGFHDLKSIGVSSHAHGANKTVYDAFLHRWNELGRPYTQTRPSIEDLCFPNHCFVLYRDVNDTELPGVQIDLKRVTVSFLWKQMLSIFYGEIEYGKWASKVMAQHAVHTKQGLRDHSMAVRREHAEGNDRQLQGRLSAVMDRAEQEESKRTSIIRTMRFKRMLERMEYQDKGQAIPDDLFARAGRATFVDSVKYALDWDRDDNEDTSNSDEERGRGCFYDGMGMKFDGKAELNEPSVASQGLRQR